MLFMIPLVTVISFAAGLSCLFLLFLRDCWKSYATFRRVPAADTLITSQRECFECELAGQTLNH